MPAVAVALLAAAALVLIVRYQPHAVGVVLAAAATLWVPAAVVDARSSRLPNRLTVAAMLVIAAGAAAVTVVDHRRVATGALVAAAMFAGPMVLVALTRWARRGIGLGDVKLALSLGGAIGLVDPLLAPFALACACVVALVARRLGGRGDGARPFGPALVVATIATLVVGRIG